MPTIVGPSPAGALRVCAVVTIAVIVGLVVGIPLERMTQPDHGFSTNQILFAALMGYLVALALVGLYYKLIARQQWSIDDETVTVRLWGRTLTVPAEEITGVRHWWIAVEFQTRVGFKSRLVMVSPQDRDLAAERIAALLIDD
jgi:hypothetical protein